jgi:deoxyribodipyrimidine photo-lyase
MKKHEARLFELHGFNGQQALNDLNDQELLDKWINGTTGDDFVDANMRELKYTGFMSNRGRQNVASYLIDQLKVDWRLEQLILKNN